MARSFFFFSSRRRHTRCLSDWSSDVCSSDLSVPISRVWRRCRLTASLKTMQQRLQTREIGTLQNTFTPRVAELNSILDRAHLEDFSLSNENRSEIGRASCRERV